MPGMRTKFVGLVNGGGVFYLQILARASAR